MSTTVSIRDALSPAARQLLDRVRDPRKVLEAAGAAVEGISVRAFRDASLRPSEWEPLTQQTLERKGGRGNLLIDTGSMIHGLRHVTSGRQVEIGSDRVYAPTHQFGRDAIPARPFIPVMGSELTPVAQEDVRSAVEAVLRGRG